MPLLNQDPISLIGLSVITLILSAATLVYWVLMRRMMQHVKDVIKHRLEEDLVACVLGREFRYSDLRSGCSSLTLDEYADFLETLAKKRLIAFIYRARLGTMIIDFDSFQDLPYNTALDTLEVFVRRI